MFSFTTSLFTCIYITFMYAKFSLKVIADPTFCNLHQWQVIKQTTLTLSQDNVPFVHEISAYIASLFTVAN